MKKLLLILFVFIPFLSYAQKQGQARIDSLLHDLANAKKDTDKVNILYLLSYAYCYTNSSEGIKYGIQGYALAEKMGWKMGMAWASQALGNNYESKSDYPKALEYYLKASKIYDNKKGLAAIAISIGNIYIHQGNYAKALEYDSMALKMQKEIGRADWENMAANLVDMGNIYASENNYPKALEYYNESLDTCEQMGDKSGIARAIGNMGIVYVNQQNYSKGLEYDFKALKAFEELKNQGFVAAISQNIGDCYLGIAQDTTGTVKAGGLIPAGKAAYLVKSIEYSEKAIETGKKIGYLEIIENAAKSLSDAYELAGNHKGALEAYKQYIIAKDSIFSVENNVKLSKLETERELQLKDKEIIINQLAVAKKRDERAFFIAGIAGLLVVILIIFRSYKLQKTTNRQLRVEKRKVEERTEELNVTNEELNTTLVNLQQTQKQLILTEKQKVNEMIRNRISQDIHDEVSSELTRISWMSKMAKLKMGKSSITDTSLLLEKITASSRETIGKLGEIIWAVNPDNDNIENFVAYLRNYISRFFADTSFHYMIDFPEQTEHLAINPELKRNLFLVVKEAINNAVKYSQARQINVALGLQDGQYKLSIADDGIGIDEKNIRGGGNGLKNMRSRMGDINGSCSIFSKPGEGTKIVFEGMLY